MSFYESATDGKTSGFSLFCSIIITISGILQTRRQLIWLGCSSDIILVTALVKLKATLLGISLFFVGKGVSCVFSHLIEMNITCGERKQSLQA